MNTIASPHSSGSQEPGPEPAPLGTPRVLHITFGLTLGMALVLAGFAEWIRAQLPPGTLVPMHWNIHGQVDRYGHSGSLFLLPGMIAFLSLLLYVLPGFESRRAHLLRAARPYCAVWFSVALLLGLIQTFIMLNVQGYHAPVASGAMIGAGIVLAVTGNYLGKVRSNHLFGVRTPWTLRSELSWNKTNRLGGRLLMLQGLIILGAAVVAAPPLALLGVMFGGFILLTVIVMVYSYRVWCADAARQR